MARAGKNTKTGKSTAKPKAQSAELKPDMTQKPKPVVDDAIIIDEKLPKDPPKEQGVNITPEKPKTGQKSSAIPLVVGGLVAGAIGFGAAIFATGENGLFGKDTSAMDQLAANNSALQTEISALKSDINALETTIINGPTNTVINGLGGRLDNLDRLTAKQTEALADLTMRITDIENRPIPDVGATAQAVETYERELTAMRQMFADELVKIETAQIQSARALTDAAIQSDSTAKQVAYAAIQKALDSGDAFDAPLATLKDAGATIPNDLSQAAAEGAITLGTLQDQFPAAARTALDAAIRADAEAGNTNKVTAFLRTQLGARSLAPKEGDDPDAILSRAEDALRQGDLNIALTELAAMPEAGAEKLNDWVQQAQARQSVLDALAELAASLGY